MKVLLLFSVILVADADKDQAWFPKSSSLLKNGMLYMFRYTTSDLFRHEEGYADGGVRGSYSFRSPEGRNYVFNYHAGHNGFQVKSDALPKSHFELAKGNIGKSSFLKQFHGQNPFNFGEDESSNDGSNQEESSEWSSEENIAKIAHSIAKIANYRAPSGEKGNDISEEDELEEEDDNDDHQKKIKENSPKKVDHGITFKKDALDKNLEEGAVNMKIEESGLISKELMQDQYEDTKDPTDKFESKESITPAKLGHKVTVVEKGVDDNFEKDDHHENDSNLISMELHSLQQDRSTEIFENEKKGKNPPVFQKHSGRPLILPPREFQNDEVDDSLSLFLEKSSETDSRDAGRPLHILRPKIENLTSKIDKVPLAGKASVKSKETWFHSKENKGFGKALLGLINPGKKITKTHDISSENKFEEQRSTEDSWFVKFDKDEDSSEIPQFVSNPKRIRHRPSFLRAQPLAVRMGATFFPPQSRGRPLTIVRGERLLTQKSVHPFPLLQSRQNRFQADNDFNKEETTRPGLLRPRIKIPKVSIESTNSKEITTGTVRALGRALPIFSGRPLHLFR